MSNFPDCLVRESIRSMQPYSGGKPIEEVQREYQLEHVIKLASNECPMPPTAKVLQAISDASQKLQEYPDGNGFFFKQALAKKHNLKPENITLGSGSSEILSLVVECFCQRERGDSLLYPKYSFLVYSLLAKAYGLQSNESSLENWQTDLQSLEEHITSNTRVIFLASPANPVGSHVGNGSMYDFIKKVPSDTLLVLDQAYADFVDDIEETVHWLKEFPNLLITRTLSKAYGLAGLRIGYGLASEKITDFLNRIRPPFNVTSLSLSAALVALQDQKTLQATIENNTKQMQRLEKWLSEKKIDWIPSKANFISFRSPIAADALYKKMLSKGIIIRPLANYGMIDYVRVTLGTPDQMDAFFQAMNDIL